MSLELCLSVAAIVIAAGALVVSVLGFRLQSRTRAEQRATRVRVWITQHSHAPLREDADWPSGLTRPSQLYTVTVVVSNDGERPATLMELGLWNVSEKAGKSENLDAPLPPGGAVSHTFELSPAMTNELRDGFVAIAALADGQSVRSDVEHLVDYLLELL